MFFRPATQIEILKDSPLEIYKKTDQYFVLENHYAVLGLVLFQEYRITIRFIDEEHYIEFLAMIEEYLFMKYSSIILLNPLKKIDLQEYLWEKYEQGLIKKKPPISDRKYCMVVPQQGSLS